MKILILILFPFLLSAQTYEISDVQVNLEAFRELSKSNRGKYYPVLKARRIARKYLEEVNLDFMDAPGIVIFSTMFDHSVGYIKNDTIKIMLWGKLRTLTVKEEADNLIVNPCGELSNLFHGGIQMTKVYD